MKIKKYIFLLIFILLLTFTLVGNCAWLSGYDQRIKLIIDNSKIDSALSDFPVTVFFTSTQAEEIFSEFDADSDYMKCAFTSSDGTTQLYAEKELFDVSESKAIYHVKVTSVSSSADTDIYYYYDNDASDNTTYIGAINTTAGGNVWDSNFKAVYHMADATTSTVVDSTSNNNDGTKKGANEPIEATGKIGQGQDFDGSDDNINITDSVTLEPSTLTVEAVIKRDGTTTRDAILQKGTTSNADGRNGYYIMCGEDDISKYLYSYIITGSGSVNVTSTGTIESGNYYYIAIRYDGSYFKNFINGVEDGSIGESNAIDYTGSYQDFKIGKQEAVGGGTQNSFDGIIDEVRVSANRSAAWIKATYNSLWDSLLTYGSEETKPVEAKDNAVFFGMNF